MSRHPRRAEIRRALAAAATVVRPGPTDGTRGRWDGAIGVGVALAAVTFGVVLAFSGQPGGLWASGGVAPRRTLAGSIQPSAAVEGTTIALTTRPAADASETVAPRADAADLLSPRTSRARAATAALAVAAGRTIKRLHRIDLARFTGRVVRRGDPRTGMVALTFDDGPTHDENTLTILHDLRSAGARATFFMVGGRLTGHSTVARAVLAQGSEIGNHTYDHVPLVRTSPATFDAQVLRTERSMFSLIGWTPKLLRPQQGRQDRAAVSMAAKAGLVLVDWDVAAFDSSKDATEGTITHNALQARAGSIVLMHESNPLTIKALPAIIAGLRARGLKLVTVSELLAASRTPSRLGRRSARRY